MTKCLTGPSPLLGALHFPHQHLFAMLLLSRVPDTYSLLGKGIKMGRHNRGGPIKARGLKTQRGPLSGGPFASVVLDCLFTYLVNLFAD